MLANNFMTPSALGISDVEFEALVKVLGMLERTEIPDEQFTMRRVQHPCRTPACLCGWANHVSAGRAAGAVGAHGRPGRASGAVNPDRAGRRTLGSRPYAWRSTTHR